MAAVLGVSAEAIDEHTSPETVESWDSLLHMNLVLALEESLQVAFDPEEIASMLSYGGILQILERKTVTD